MNCSQSCCCRDSERWGAQSLPCQASGVMGKAPVLSMDSAPCRPEGPGPRSPLQASTPLTGPPACSDQLPRGRSAAGGPGAAGGAGKESHPNGAAVTGRPCKVLRDTSLAQERGELCREAAFELSLGDGGHLGRGPGYETQRGAACQGGGQCQAPSPRREREAARPAPSAPTPPSGRAERGRREAVDATHVRVRQAVHLGHCVTMIDTCNLPTLSQPPCNNICSIISQIFFK